MGLHSLFQECLYPYVFVLFFFSLAHVLITFRWWSLKTETCEGFSVVKLVALDVVVHLVFMWGLSVINWNEFVRKRQYHVLYYCRIDWRG
jgi:uncharacterized membrane protein YwzB